jgi:hypothetical protein
VGAFLESVQGGRVAHPWARGFDRKVWVEAKPEDDLDDGLIASVLPIADLIDTLRPHAQTRTHNSTLLRALVAYGNIESRNVHRDILVPAVEESEAGIYVDSLLLKKHPETRGTLGELTDGLGDSLVFPLREAINPSWAFEQPGPTKEAWRPAVERAAEQGMLSNRWYLCWFFLMDIIWLNARLTKESSHEWVLRTDPNDPARQIGMWRRQMNVESLAMGRIQPPPNPPASLTKTISCDWVGNRLVYSARKVSDGREAWAHRIYAYAAMPGALVSPAIEDVALDIHGTSVTVGEAARVYASFLALFHVMLARLPQRKYKADAHRRDAFPITIENFQNVLSDVVEIDPKKVAALLDYATFTGRGGETLWGRPLVFGGGSARFVFLAALKSSVLRTINQLIDRFAGDNGRKGIFFQEHCRRELVGFASKGLFKGASWVAPRPVKTPAGDIDICVIVASVLLIVEAKYIPFPCDAHDYWRVDRTIDDAGMQVERKVKEVTKDRRQFIESLRTNYGLDLQVEEVADVVPIVLVSDTYRSGFSTKGVYVADLETMEAYLTNRLLQVQEKTHEGTRLGGSYVFDTMLDALGGLRNYFDNPPTVSGLKRSIGTRETNYPTDIHSGDHEIRVRFIGTGLPER